MNLPGLHTFAVPMQGPLGTVNVHLIELEDGYLLVDTGWGSDESFQALESGLAARGASWADIRTLLVTHLHPDHVGNAREVLERSGARFLMHQVDVENLEHIAEIGRSPFFDEAWTLAGVPPELRAKLDSRMRVNRRSFPPEPNWKLEGGERLNIRGGSLEIVWTPGHSAGHVCLHSPEHRYLIAGDHVLEKITPNVGWRPGHDMLAQFLDSLDVIGRLDIDWVIPSHGSPFPGLAARIDAMRDHHGSRCDRILRQIADAPLSAHEIVERLWTRRLGLLEHNLALLEVLAHLEYLRRRGPVSADARPDGSIEWRQS